MSLSISFFVLYIAIVVLIGWFASKNETEEGFMIADRRVAGISLAITMTAGFFDGATIAVYTAYVYQFGLSALWLFVGFSCGFLVLKNFAPRIKRIADERGIYSLPEYFYKTIGSWSGVMFSVILVIALSLLLVVNLIVSGKVLSTIFPISYPLAVGAGGVIILTYLFLAGLKAVIKTDVFQFFIMIVMSLSVALFLVGRSSFSASDFNPTALGAGNLTGFFFLGALSAIVGPDLWQRIFASKDERALRRGLTYGALLIPLLAAVIGIMGLATKQFFPNIVPEDALVHGFAHLLPLGFMELGMVLLYAVSLSSSDTMTFCISSIITRDILNYSHRFKDSSMRFVTRVIMVTIIILAVFISIVSQDILTIGFALGGIGISIAPAVLLSFSYRLNDRAVGASLFLAVMSVIPLFVLDILSPETALIPLPIAFLFLLVFQGVARCSQKHRCM
ncbi:MAG TPA: sodium:solute symporter family protein [Candidatus Peribacterales bacterium]|nr:sodium:solute symporter family protein [Candidatus Peribacterales bacterium]